MSTETPDDEAAWQDWRNTNREWIGPHAVILPRRAFLAGYAAGSARLDALHAENAEIQDELDLAYRQLHAEEMHADPEAVCPVCEHLEHEDTLAERDAARAERDALRDAITALADEYERIKPTRPTWESVAANLRALLNGDSDE